MRAKCVCVCMCDFYLKNNDNEKNGCVKIVFNINRKEREKSIFLKKTMKIL